MNIMILPVKLDSKRIPLKLIKDFCGKPLYAHVCEQIKKMFFPVHVYVSSSDQTLAEAICNEYNFSWIQRPESLNGDVELTEVIKHATKEITQSSGHNIMQVQLNKPLTKAFDLDHCLATFLNNKYDTLSTVQEIGTTAIGADVKYKSQAICKIWKSEYLLQDSIKSYAYSDNHCYLPIAKHHIEIDDMEDWKIAEALYKAGF